jgi:hypothetical protein
MSEQGGRRRLSDAAGRRLRVNLVRVAGLAAGLGLLMEGVLVLGGEAAATLTDLLDKGLWPFLVCMAVALGQSVVGGWPPRVGAFALVATPVAFLLAKVIHKGMSVLMDGTAPGGFITDAQLLEAGLRAVEYAVLAAALAWLGRQSWAGALAHLGLGLGVGMLFGPLIALFLTPDSLLGWLLEELLFPTACALIIFASETLTRMLPEETVPGTPA